MPVLLFGCESWYLTDTTLDDLERFQCNIYWKKDSSIVSFPLIHIGLDWPSVRARVLIQKLNYPRRLVKKGDDKFSSQIFHLFASKDIS